jgi:alkyl sulfatase BDS1-like metallo-beta-lactamase superfamily hydrolase
MADPTTEFFDALAGRGHDRRLEKVSGTLRFDLERDGHPEHWLLEVRQGDVRAWQAAEPQSADCVLRTSRAWFNKFVTGVENVLPALLRTDAVAEGDIRLLVLLQRVMPNPPGARDPRDLRRPAGETR